MQWILFLYPSVQQLLKHNFQSSCFRLHAIPSDVVSHHGPRFFSQVWRAFCTTLGAKVSLFLFLPWNQCSNRAPQSGAGRWTWLCRLQPLILKHSTILGRLCTQYNDNRSKVFCPFEVPASLFFALEGGISDSLLYISCYGRFVLPSVTECLLTEVVWFLPFSLIFFCFYPRI